MESNMTQMNVRLETNLKNQGDAALAHAGYSPSQAARKLWTLAAKLRHNPKLLSDILEGTVIQSSHLQTNDLIEKKLNYLKESDELIEQLYQSLDQQSAHFLNTASYEDLREALYKNKAHNYEESLK